MLGHFLAFVIVSHCPKSLAASCQQLFEHPVGSVREEMFTLSLIEFHFSVTWL